MNPERVTEIAKTWYRTINEFDQLEVMRALEGAINQALGEASFPLETETDSARRQKQRAEDNILVLQDQLRDTLVIIKQEGIPRGRDIIRWENLAVAKPQDDMRSLSR